jgi:hypothetical protein
MIFHGGMMHHRPTSPQPAVFTNVVEGEFSEVGRCLYCYLSPRYIRGGDMFSLFLKLVGNKCKQ